MGHDKSRGIADVPEYRAWYSIKKRCLDPKAEQFKNYGARGIGICAEWVNDYRAFYAHVGPRPSPKHSIDRIDNDGNYEPGNVRWATRTTQSRNSRWPRLSELDADCIRYWHAAGLSQGDLSFVFRLSGGHVSRVVNHKIWRKEAA